MNCIISKVPLNIENHDCLVVSEHTDVYTTITKFGLEFEKYILKNNYYEKYDNVIICLNDQNTNFTNCGKLRDDELIFSSMVNINYIIGSLQSITKFAAGAKYMDSLQIEIDTERMRSNTNVDKLTWLAIRLGLKLYQDKL